MALRVLLLLLLLLGFLILEGVERGEILVFGKVSLRLFENVRILVTQRLRLKLADGYFPERLLGLGSPVKIVI